MNEHLRPTNPDNLRPQGIWNTWSRSEILGLFFLFLAGNFFFQIVIFQVSGGVFWPVIAGAVLGVGLPLALILRVRKLSFRRDFFLDRPPWPVMTASSLLAVAALAPTSLLAELSLRLTPADQEVVAFMQESLPTTVLGMVLAAVAVVLVGPLVEEIIFRGLLHRLASGIWGPLAGTAVSSLVFGILHGEAWILFGLIGVGVLLAFVFEATGSVTACWMTHATYNAISLVLMIRQEPGPLEPSPLGVADWTLAVGSLVAMFFIGRFLLSCRPHTEESPTGRPTHRGF